MKLEQHHTPGRPRVSLSCFDVQIDSECCSDKGWSEMKHYGAFWCAGLGLALIGGASDAAL